MIKNIIISICYGLRYLYLKTKVCFRNDINFKNYYTELDVFNKIITRNRSEIKLIKIDNKYVVNKTFFNTEIGNQSYKNEVFANSTLKEYNWVPKVTEVGPNWIRYEYIPNKYRLDLLKYFLSASEIKDITNQIIDIILTLYKYGLAHRDIHLKNLYYNGSRLILTDFENITKLKKETEFFDSYDISGKNLESPLKSVNMCILSDQKYSIKNILPYNNIIDLKQAINNIITYQLIKSNQTFFTRKNNLDGRHKVKGNKIYSTYDLKYTKVAPENAQRNTSKRIEQLTIDKSDIEHNSVLDLGSHTGGMLFELLKWNPKYAIGFEYDVDKVKISQNIHALNCKYSPVDFFAIDLESREFIVNYNTTFDVVICLAILGHIRNKQEFLNKVFSICKKTLFLEGNANTNKDEIINYLYNSGFKEVNFLGYSNDETNSKNNNRPLFKATR